MKVANVIRLIAIMPSCQLQKIEIEEELIQKQTRITVERE